ncbi:MAG: glycoside hydrolase domain-containing protein, partial [Tepidisphaeraceae bacterium]
MDTRLIIRRLLTMTLGFVLARQAAADWHVWTLTETRHVLGGDAPGGSSSVQIAAARNEWESFQILLRSDAPVRGVRVEPGDFKNLEGAVLSARHARLYRQHQTELKQGTQRNDAFKPDWYPDALIPFLNPITGEPLAKARFVAVPFDLPADRTQGFWVDVNVPADAKAGVYRGVYRVTAQDQSPVEIPVELTIWDFTLPPTPTLVTEFGSPAGRMRGYYAALAKAGKEPEPKD